MPDFKNIDEYEIYIRDLSLEELRGINRKIDKDNYPDRYDLVCRLIKNKEIIPIDDARNEKKHYPSGVILIRNIHFILIVVGFIGLIYNLISQSKEITIASVPNIAIYYMASALIVYGISYVKQWVWLLALVNAYLTFIWISYNMLFYTRSSTPHNDIFVMDIMIIVFIFYQIYIFSKSETKLHFKAKNNIII